jgi:putative pyruvate formate lyase activating enzyme
MEFILFRPDVIGALERKRAKVCLPRYRKILLENLPAKFLIAKSIEVEHVPKGKRAKLRLHEQKMREFRKILERIDGGGATIEEMVLEDRSLLDLKVEICREIMQNCTLCERRCKVNRLKGEKGFCGVGESKIASEFLHYGEEPELVPSYTIFFSGCNFCCVYCQNWSISQFPEEGVHIPPKILARMIRQRRVAGAKNLNLVGGEPTPNLLYILEVLKECDVNIPIVWNSNFYMSKEAMNLLDGVVDVYLTDFRYGNDSCAKRLSKVENYFKVAARNHSIASKQGELIIRQLVLPNHFECCTKPIIDWIGKNLGKRVYINIMGQYRPEYKARDYPEISRRLRASEHEEAIRYAIKKGFERELL